MLHPNFIERIEENTMSASGVGPTDASGGQLFSNPNRSATSEGALLALWNVGPNMTDSQVTEDRNEIYNDPNADKVAQGTANLLGFTTDTLERTRISKSDYSMYSSEVQRDILYSLDHDQSTNTNFDEAAKHALQFALDDKSSEVSDQDRAALQDSLAHVNTLVDGGYGGVNPGF